MGRYSAYAYNSDDEFTSDSTASDAEPLPPQETREDNGEEAARDEENQDEVPIREKPQVHFATSPPPREDPTITPWAREIGVDPQKMHVMQSSLFRLPEEAAAMKASSQPSRKKLVFHTSPNRKHSRDSDGDGLRESRQVRRRLDGDYVQPESVTKRPSFAHDVEPEIYRPTRKYARVEGSASAVNGHEDAFIDAGLAFGRSFRVGWGPAGTLAHLGSLCTPAGTSKSANSSTISISTVPLLSQPPHEVKECSTRLLGHQLSNSSIVLDADGVPFATPFPNLSFSSFASLFAATDRSFEASMFRLGCALFDPSIDSLDPSTSVDIRNRVQFLRRRAALSSWLRNAVASSVDGDLRDNPTSDWATTVFTLLSGNQIEKACEIAVDTGNLKVATLLSQIAGDDDFKDDLRNQLDIWREERVDIHINEKTRKIYALMAGIVDVLRGSQGTGIERCPDISIARGLDWKRAFGLHLWYGEAMDTSISDVLAAYDRLWKEKAADVAPPVPWYIESPVPSPEAGLPSWHLPDPTSPPDICYSFIKLFTDPSLSLANILTPFSYGPSPSDYRLSWHLYILFSRCLRVRDFPDRGDPGGYRYEDEDEDGNTVLVEGHSPSADLLANSYALQLEQAGLMQEAVFVLLHIEGSVGREKAIKALLARSAPRLNDWTTRGLVGSMKIPMIWINEAKAVYALSNGDVFGAYELYLSAGLYKPAHELAVLELAPDAIIRQDYALIKELFERITGKAVDGWYVRGKALVDYAHAMIRLPELRERMNESAEIPDASDAEELEELIRSVPKLIGILPDIFYDRSDARHNAAIATMIDDATQQLDRVKPLALSPAQVRSSLASDRTKLHHVSATAYERFLRTVKIT